MITLVTVVHILVSIGLILVVLLQTGKGADIGAVFGGSSSTIFGSSGAGNFLTRVTTGMAIVFMITSLTLGYFSGKKPSASIFDRGSAGVEQPARSPAGQPTQGQAGEPQAPQPQGSPPQKPSNP
jgi:preprotein translocase subunit SecG